MLDFIHAILRVGPCSELGPSPLHKKDSAGEQNKEIVGESKCPRACQGSFSQPAKMDKCLRHS